MKLKYKRIYIWNLWKISNIILEWNPIMIMDSLLFQDISNDNEEKLFPVILHCIESTLGQFTFAKNMKIWSFQMLIEIIFCDWLIESSSHFMTTISSYVYEIWFSVVMCWTNILCWLKARFIKCFLINVARVLSLINKTLKIKNSSDWHNVHHNVMV